MNNDILCYMRAKIAGWFSDDSLSNRILLFYERSKNSPNVRRLRGTSITRILVVVQLCSNVVLTRLSILNKRFHDLSDSIAWGALNCCCGHGMLLSNMNALTISVDDLEHRSRKQKSRL